MKSRKNGIIIWLLVFLSAMLMGAEGGGAPEAEERRLLAEQKRQLAGKIETLKREQDYLLFQRSLYASDSKYLLLDVAAGKGTLKYRNRTLRTFEFSRAGRARGASRTGECVLTAKADGSPGKRMLVFGNDIIIHTKKHPGTLPGAKGTGNAARLVIGSKDMASIFYAVEPGTRLYVVR